LPGRQGSDPAGAGRGGQGPHGHAREDQVTCGSNSTQKGNMQLTIKDTGARSLRVLGVAGTIAAMLAASPAQADEVSELKAAVQALQKRIETLEAQAKSTEETNDRQTDQIAQARTNVPGWVPNFTLKGDLRYRNENIDQQYAVARNRDRIRVRAGFVAKVNDTVTSELQLAS